MSVSDETMMFQKVNDVPSASEVLRDVYHALQEKGYNPVEQDRKSVV